MGSHLGPRRAPGGALFEGFQLRTRGLALIRAPQEGPGRDPHSGGPPAPGGWDPGSGTPDLGVPRSGVPRNSCCCCSSSCATASAASPRWGDAATASAAATLLHCWCCSGCTALAGCAQPLRGCWEHWAPGPVLPNPLRGCQRDTTCSPDQPSHTTRARVMCARARARAPAE